MKNYIFSNVNPEILKRQSSWGNVYRKFQKLSSEVEGSRPLTKKEIKHIKILFSELIESLTDFKIENLK